MGWSEKRGSTWRARFKLPDGTYDSASGFRTRDQADAHWQAMETDVRRGDWFDPTAGQELTFAEWAEQWLLAVDLAPDSEYNYGKRIRKINLRWGDVPLSRITTSGFQIWEKAIRAENSHNYASQVVALFRMILGDAVTHQPPLLKTSPAPAVNRKRGRYVSQPTTEIPTVTPLQVEQAAVNAFTVWGFTGYVAYLTKAYCGLRQGELCGLRREWCYPNWPASDPGWAKNPRGRTAERKRVQEARKRYSDMPALRVQWQHQYVRPPEGGKRRPELVPPKYGSARDLVLPPFLAHLIETLLETHDSPWVFPAMNGGPLLLTDFSTYMWQPTVHGAEERVGRYARPAIEPVEGLEEAVPHWLRHAMKRWLDEDGHPRVVVETRMGHRLQGVEGVYSGVTPTMERRVAESLQLRWESLRSESPIQLPLDLRELIARQVSGGVRLNAA